ncbi:cytochrome b5-like [Anopheles cruzii]|uniref:cytochrome b5-like n=1 Tax=Anopheles cruzii TaxID=68878 RepID=UPI0022EC846F|nr:cytochrome b5-like [Anopheles cruzii]
MPAEVRQYTMADVALRDGKNGTRTWIVVSDIVYDVTDYMENHPGGSELITEWAGKDGTKDFDDFGHSSDAMKELKTLQIGVLVEEDRAKNRKAKSAKSATVEQTEEESKPRKRRRFIMCC